MRRYDILFGILLILSIINLALTAPVLVQEKCHACVDAMHTPKDKIAALERRGNDDLDRLAKMAVDYIKNYLKKVQKPNVSPNPASATAPGTSQGKWWHDGPDGPTYTPMSLEYGSDHVSTGVDAPKPNPSDNPYFRWNYLMNKKLKKLPPLPVTPVSLIKFGQFQENQVEHVQHLNPGLSTDPNFDWNYRMGSNNLPLPKRPKQGTSKELDDEVA